MKNYELTIESGGRIRLIYDDEMIDLIKEGESIIRRASTVEPDNNGGWIVDLSMSSGPKIGPFDRREDALKAETDWLKENWL